MKIEKEVFYHIFTKYNDFEYQLNYSYPIGNGPNYFWQGFFQCEMRYNKEPFIGKYAAKLASLYLSSPLLFNNVHSKDIISFLGNSVFEMGMLIRELVFEDYRRYNYPNLPSRQTSIYLMDNIVKDHWMHELIRKGVDQKIITLECSGEIHKGSSLYLNSDSFTYLEYQKNAENYWNSNNLGSNYEILFTGNAKVISIETV